MNPLRRSLAPLKGLWGQSIRRQLAWSFSLVTLAIILGSGCLLFNFQRDFLYTQGTNRALDLAQTLSFNSVSWVLADDVAGLQEVLKGAAKTTDIKFAVVLTPQGEVLAATRPEYIGQYFSDAISLSLLKRQAEPQILLDESNLIDVAVPIQAGRSLIGWARVELTREAENANLHGIAAAGLGMALVLLLTITLIAAWLARRLTRGLNRLAGVAEDAKHGRTFQREDIARMDEIGLLARHLYRALDAIEEESRVRLESEARLRTILDSVDAYIYLKDTEGRYLFANRAVRELWQAGMEDIVGFGDEKFFDAATAANIRRNDCRVLEHGETLRADEVNTLPATGETVFYHSTKLPLRRENGCIYALCGISFDITERKHAEQTQIRLARALRLLSKCNALLVHAADEQEILANICKLVVETGGYKMSWVGFAENDAAKTVRPVAQSGYDQGYLDSVDITWSDTPHGQGPTGTAIRTGATVVNQNSQIDPNMNPWCPAAMQRGYKSSIALPLISKQQILGALNIYSAEPSHIAFAKEEVMLLEELASDLAYGIQTLRTRIEHAAAEKKLEFQAHHDALTGLPNRLLLRDRFDQATALAHRERSGMAVLFLDLDNFKYVNDSLGHAFGDQLLMRVVERIQACIRDSDTISRQGGDEFVILLTNMHDMATIDAIAQNIIDAFAEPFEIDHHALSISFSIGISLFPKDGHDFDTLLKQADTALYQAKDAGRNTYRFSSQQMNMDAMENVRLHSQLHNALKNQELLLHYQPQIDLVSGHIIGAEALVRWQHPELGLVSPAKFIPLAERSGLIIPMGEWVLKEACRQAQAWRETCRLPHMVIAVNLSAVQFKRGNIVETVTRALAQSGLPASQLELELTESILLHDMEAAMKTLHGLKEIGVQLSIDDFGTGYSSLSYLKRLAVDKLKIDQSFVRDMVENPEDAGIVQAIIQLGHTLQLTVIAEGVENDAQLDFLRNHGCDEVQGYLFSRPIPAEKYADLLSKEHPA